VDRGDWRRRARLGLVLVLFFAASSVLAAEPASFAFGGELGGRVLLSYDPNLSPALDVALSDLALLLRLRVPGGWAFYTRASLSNDEFTYLALGAEGKLGPLDSRAQAVFDPSASDPFRYFSWLLSWRVGDLRFGNTLFLSGDPGHSYNQLALRAAVAGLAWSGFARFRIGTCYPDDAPPGAPTAFAAAQVRVDALLFSCGVPAQAKLVMSDEGFDALELLVRGIPMPLLSTSHLETTLDLVMRFEMTGKTLVPTLQTLVGSACAGVQPYIEFLDAFPFIEGISVYGIAFSYALSDSLEISSATCFDVGDPLADPNVTAHNLEVTGESLYYERLSASGLVPGCCGPSTEWSFDLYFEREAPSLFDWGRVNGGVSFPLGAATVGSFEMEFSRTGAWLVYFGLSTKF
jgi:hypothetical protein